jgi:hypothetical protein
VINHEGRRECRKKDCWMTTYLNFFHINTASANLEDHLETVSGTVISISSREIDKVRTVFIQKTIVSKICSISSSLSLDKE